MGSYRTAAIAFSLAVGLSLLFCRPAQAADPLPAASPQAQTTTAPSTGTPTPAKESNWHFAVTPYLWLAGVHGTVGAFDRDISVHASIGEVLSHFDFGLMGTAEARYKRVVLPLDLIWIRLEDSKSVPYPGLHATSADAKFNEFLLTPKVGYRVVDREKLKIDGVTGFRFWHLGTNLHFNPSLLGLNFSRSDNWVDPLVGWTDRGGSFASPGGQRFGECGWLGSRLTTRL